MSPLARTRGVREVIATCDSDSVAEADGSLMFPEVLRPAPGEGISACLIVPHVGKVLQGAPVGKGHSARHSGAVLAAKVSLSTSRVGLPRRHATASCACLSSYRW